MIEVLFPIMIVLGRLLGISKEKIQQSFVEVNNLLVKAKCRDSKPRRTVSCRTASSSTDGAIIKITTDAYKCQACGKCR